MISRGSLEQRIAALEQAERQRRDSTWPLPAAQPLQKR